MPTAAMPATFIGPSVLPNSPMDSTLIKMSEPAVTQAYAKPSSMCLTPGRKTQGAQRRRFRPAKTRGDPAQHADPGRRYTGLRELLECDIPLAFATTASNR